MTSWDKKFIELSDNIAKWSKDKSTKIGCVIVGPDNEIRSTGYNGMPRCVNDSELSRHERPIKYLYTEHAERNAVYAAARVGVSLKGCKMYTRWYPCADCARAIIQSGISELFCEAPSSNTDKFWLQKEHLEVTKTMLRESNIKVTYLPTNNYE